MYSTIVFIFEIVDYSNKILINSQQPNRRFPIISSDFGIFKLTIKVGDSDETS